MHANSSFSSELRRWILMAFPDVLSYGPIATYQLALNSPCFYVHILPTLATVFLRPINSKTSQRKTINLNKKLQACKETQFHERKPFS